MERFVCICLLPRKLDNMWAMRASYTYIDTELYRNNMAPSGEEPAVNASGRLPSQLLSGARLGAYLHHVA